MTDSHQNPQSLSTKRKLRISVTDFINSEERFGSIDLLRNFTMQSSLHLLGQEVHKRVQNRLTLSHSNYSSEYSIKYTFETELADVEISGRIDGLFEDANSACVEEIKSTQNTDFLIKQLNSNHNHPYSLQTLLYAFLIYNTKKTPVTCQLRIVSVHDADEETIIPLEFDPENVKHWFEFRVKQVIEQEEINIARQAERAAIAEKLTFPFEKLRQGQDSILNAVSEIAAKGSKALIQASTGLGKTAGVLFPMLQNAMRKGLQVFYITPKNSQHALAEDVIQRLNNNGFKVKSVTLNAKEKVCFKDEVICQPEYCEFAKNYYDKIKEQKTLDELDKIQPVTPQVLREIAERHEVCPFELSLDYTARCDVIIGDYNYVFSPNAALHRYFNDDNRTHLLNLIVDEAHNLHTRFQEYFSPQLSFLKVSQWLEEINSSENLEISDKTKKRAIKLFQEALLLINSEAGTLETEHKTVQLDREKFFKYENKFGRFLSTYSSDKVIVSPKHPFMVFNQYYMNFCSILRLPGNQFTFTLKRTDEDSLLSIVCCDASEELNRRLNSFHSLVAFSATLKPFSFYLSKLGLVESETFTTEIHASFPTENRKILIIPQISTLWKNRDKQITKIAEAITKIVSLKKGNYLIFFPSFVFLDKIYDATSLPGFRMYRQSKGQKNDEINKMLEKFSQKTKNIVVFAVQGGSLSEGIDLPGNKLIGTIIVGPSLPYFDLENECIRRFHDTKYSGKGFDYTYTYPAMSRVVQAAGRVIRTEDDKGIIVLMDGRFLETKYAESMPKNWFKNSPHELVSKSILSDISAFWNLNSGAADGE